MRRIAIDFSPRARRARWLDTGLFCVGLAAAIVTAWVYVTLAQRNEALSDRVGTVRRALERSAAIRAEAVPAAAAGPRTAVAWSDLFGRLEQTADESVTFISLQGDAATGDVEIFGEAKDSAAVFALLGRLHHRGGFADIALRSQEVVGDQPSKPVRFNLSMKWEAANGGR